jgi:WD40 repeat protein
MRFTVSGQGVTPTTTLTANAAQASSIGYVDGQTLGTVSAAYGVGLSLFRADAYYAADLPSRGEGILANVPAFYYLPQPSTVWSFAADPRDSHWIVTAGSDGALRWARWNNGIETGEEVAGGILPRSATSVATLTDEDILNIYDFALDRDGQPVPTLRAAANIGADTSYRIGAGNLASPAQQLVTATPNEVTVWDVSDAAIAHWPARNPRAAPPQVAPLVRIPRTPRTTTDAALSPDGRRLAIGTPGGLELWDLTNPAAPKLLGKQATAHKATGEVKVAFSADGRLLTSTSNDKVLKIWEVAKNLTGDATGTLALDAGQNRVAFSPTHPIVAVGGDDHRVRLIDVTNPGQPRLAGTSPSQAFEVVGLAFSPDGRQLLAGASEDIRIWDVTDPANLRRTLSLPGIRGENYPFRSAAFLGNSRYLVVGRENPAASLYDLDIGADVRRLCAGIGNVITQVEWDSYLNDVPYTRPCGDDATPAGR